MGDASACSANPAITSATVDAKPTASPIPCLRTLKSSRCLKGSRRACRRPGCGCAGPVLKQNAGRRNPRSANGLSKSRMSATRARFLLYAFTVIGPMRAFVASIASCAIAVFPYPSRAATPAQRFVSSSAPGIASRRTRITRRGTSSLTIRCSDRGYGRVLRIRRRTGNRRGRSSSSSVSILTKGAGS